MSDNTPITIHPITGASTSVPSIHEAWDPVIGPEITEFINNTVSKRQPRGNSGIGNFYTFTMCESCLRPQSGNRTNYWLCPKWQNDVI